MNAICLDNGRAPLDFRALSGWRATVSFESNTLAERVAQLTDGQRDCLRLVYQHMTSKDIARVLGVSPHTVDMRLRTAMRTLDVQSRIEAARALIFAEGVQGDYQPLIYQAPELVPGAAPGDQQGPASNGDRDRQTHDFSRPDRPVAGPTFNGPPRLTGASANYEPVVSTDWPGAGLPDPEVSTRPFAASRPWGARNTMGVGARLGWIAGIAIGSAMAFGGILSALAALKSLI
jgi:DNA-binding CsgD family transcriptional regulator